MIKKFFSNRLSELRIKKGISARDMSLSLGYSEGYINKIENGKTFPSMQVFFYICEFLEISPREFFPCENTVSPDKKNLEKILNNLEILKLDDLKHISAIIESLANSK